MKKQLLFLISLFALSFSFGQTIIYEQDFNGATIPTQWGMYNGSSGTQEWTFGENDVPGSGFVTFSSNAAIFDDNVAGDTGNNDQSMLYYPYDFNVLDLSAYSDDHILLEFDYALDVVGSSGDDTLEFMYYNNISDLWETLYTYTDDIGPTHITIDVTQLLIDTPDININDFAFGFRYNDVDSNWAWGAGIDNVTLTAYDRPINDLCVDSMEIIVGHDFDSYPIEATLEHCTANSSPYDYFGVWFSFEVPDSGNVTIETDYATGSVMHDTYMFIYSGTCGSLVDVDDDDNGGNGDFSKLELTGQTPGEMIYVEIQADISSSDPLDSFMIAAYDSSIPAPPANDICANATNLTVGTSFDQFDQTGTLLGATAVGANAPETNGVWYSFTVPSTGNVIIETDYAAGSQLYNTFLFVAESCGAATYITYDDESGNGGFSKIVLSGQTPGNLLVVEVEEDNGASDPVDTFRISVYDISLSIEDTVIEGFTMYPNPVENQLNLSAVNVISEVVIYNILGESVLKINPNVEKSSIDVSNLSTGTYIVKIHSADQIGAYKFIKQ